MAHTNQIDEGVLGGQVVVVAISLLFSWLAGVDIAGGGEADDDDDDDGGRSARFGKSQKRINVILLGNVLTKFVRPF